MTKSKKVKVSCVPCLKIKVGSVTKKCFSAQQATDFYMGYRLSVYTTVPPAQIYVNKDTHGKLVVAAVVEPILLTNRRKRLESRVLSVFKKYLP